MKKSRLSNKEKMEILIGKLVILIIESLVGVGLILGFFWVLGVVSGFLELHSWLLIPLFAFDIILILKEIK
jgi:hypothetical protein